MANCIPVLYMSCPVTSDLKFKEFYTFRLQICHIEIVPVFHIQAVYLSTSYHSTWFGGLENNSAFFTDQDSFPFEANSWRMFCNIFIKVTNQEDVFFQVRQAAPAFQLTCYEIHISPLKGETTADDEMFNEPPHPSSMNFTLDFEGCTRTPGLVCH